MPGTVLNPISQKFLLFVCVGGGDKRVESGNMIIPVDVSSEMYKSCTFPCHEFDILARSLLL